MQIKHYSMHEASVRLEGKLDDIFKERERKKKNQSTFWI